MSYIATQLIAALLSFVVPKDKKLYAFGAGDGTSFNGNPKYLYLYTIRQKNAKAIWLTHDKDVHDRLKRKNLPVFLLSDFKGFWTLVRSRYLFIEKSSFDLSYTRSILGRFSYVQTNHGIALKKVGNDAKKKIANSFLDKLFTRFKIYSNLRYAYLISTSKEVNKKLRSAFENPNIIITGYPRNDIFFDPDIKIQDYRSELKLNRYRRVWLYAPTFRDRHTGKLPFSRHLGRLNRYFSEQNDILLVKTHPYEKLLNIPDELSNIKNVSSIVDDIQELLILCDVLITDYSSSFFDFILTDRPVIFFAYDLEDYLEKCRGMYYDYYKELPGPFAKNEEELYKLISSIDSWSADEKYQKKYLGFKKRFHQYTDGKSAERVFDLLK